MRAHPVNGITLGFPRPGEAVVTAYGNFGAADFVRLLADAYHVVERNTGKRPAGGFLTLRAGVIEVRISQEMPAVRANSFPADLASMERAGE